MKKSIILTIIGAGLLSACSSDYVVDVAAKTSQTVNYLCGAKHDLPLQVDYQFIGDDAVYANVHFNGTVYENLKRDTTNNDSNLFKNSNNIVWVADKFDLTNVQIQHGIMLYKDGEKTDTVIAKYCDIR